MTWNVSPELISFGIIHVRWYGALFALSFVLAYQMIKRMYKQDGFPEERVDSLLWYMMAAVVIGARVGHCLFYQPEIYLPDPIRILKVWEGGLASHGAAVGIAVGVWAYTRKYKEYTPLEVLDRVAIGVALSGFFIRLGNFFNSEILGKPASIPWAITFARVDQIPRHPAQLYESFSYLIIFIFLFRRYWKTPLRLQRGYFFGLAMALIFGARFFLEFFKENQEAFEGSLPINMGQILSIPAVSVGIYLMVTSKNRMTEVKKGKHLKIVKA